MIPHPEKEKSTLAKAEDVLKANEVAVVVFTHGDYFRVDGLGNGETGIWVVDPEMVDTVDKVIVYLRDQTENKGRVFVGNYAGYKPSGVKRRFYIRFSRLIQVGITLSNWFEFGDGSQNPVCYTEGR